LTAATDGQALSLLKLRGKGVPTDVEVYLCNRTFVALQVRVKNLDNPENLVHEYALEPQSVNPSNKGGVYELQCLHSKHQLQVKVQPALGLAELLSPYKEDATSGELGALVEKELWPFMGVFYILSAFLSDVEKKSVPLTTGYDDSPKHIEWLLADSRMLDGLCIRCSVFSRSYGQPPSLNLVEPMRPKTRGMLLKAFLEVKMVIIRAITQIRLSGETLLSEQQFGAFEELMLYVYQDCCAGGVDEQFQGLEESMDSLRVLVCGAMQSVPAKDAPRGGGGEPGKVLESSEKQCVSSGDRSKLERLHCVLSDAVRHLEASNASLNETVVLAGSWLDAERSCLTELSGKVKRRTEDVQRQLREMVSTPGKVSGAVDANASKRSRTQ